MAPAVTATAVSGEPQDYEEQHVHAVYEEIAPHFSSTRYKPWPIIAAFLASLPPGWVGLDSGTGNGKYLPLPLERPGSIWTIGLDRSHNLLDIARAAGGNGTIREVVRGDVLGQPWRDGAFDYAISIATIHHLSSYERRKQSVQRLIQSVSPSHGRVLIYVWAIEQDDLSKRAIPTENESQSNGQDVFVPWVLSSQLAAKEHKNKSASMGDGLVENNTQDMQKAFNRYYHMFSRGELADLLHGAARELGLHIGSHADGHGSSGIEIVQDGWERSNYYVEFRRWQT